MESFRVDSTVICILLIQLNIALQPGIVAASSSSNIKTSTSGSAANGAIKLGGELHVEAAANGIVSGAAKAIESTTKETGKIINDISKSTGNAIKATAEAVTNVQGNSSTKPSGQSQTSTSNTAQSSSGTNGQKPTGQTQSSTTTGSSGQSSAGNTGQKPTGQSQGSSSTSNNGGNVSKPQNQSQDGKPVIGNAGGSQGNTKPTGNPPRPISGMAWSNLGRPEDQFPALNFGGNFMNFIGGPRPAGNNGNGRGSGNFGMPELPNFGFSSSWGLSADAGPLQSVNSGRGTGGSGTNGGSGSTGTGRTGLNNGGFQLFGNGGMGILPNQQGQTRFQANAGAEI